MITSTFPLSGIKSLGAIIVNLIYPNHCLVCNASIDWQEARPICGQCWQGVINHSPPFCSKCGRPLKETANPALIRKKLCSNCITTKYYFQQGWTAAAFNGIIKNCIHLLKYQGKISLADPLSSLMAGFYKQYLKDQKFDLIIPVPLSRLKYRQREFNQAELLARQISRTIGLKTDPNNLIRTRPAPAQVQLDRVQRLMNLKDAFKVKKPAKAAGRNILLIDDVFTTGSTLNECAHALLKAGARQVSVFALARG